MPTLVHRGRPETSHCFLLPCLALPSGPTWSRRSFLTNLERGLPSCGPAPTLLPGTGHPLHPASYRAVPEGRGACSWLSVSPTLGPF